ncbi:MAG: hypothetical protein MPJ06_08285 [Nitrosopumilus sp.]|nr:hypothetical protein [Nitrosopumilus sp.]MDA7942141.1 hypothetical protein [Nitrosopumilus sp.]MDA7943978.1 hypothetical protein [Nitrosopumilus sp.]MDA7955342.1 hypothetical protein [Nitrosopumilus sp.]MDA7998171.1 hypothetical protein [Nitrosopumilus sp.]
MTFRDLATVKIGEGGWLFHVKHDRTSKYAVGERGGIFVQWLDGVP